MSKNILSVSYDASLLATRRMLLEQRGLNVTSALGYTQAIAHCNTPDFDLFILGHSIPLADKEELIRTFRRHCPAPILSLERHGEEKVPCDFHSSPDEPEDFLATVDRILSIGATPKAFEKQVRGPDHAPQS
jgi:DNA-binding NtrC family response regulator